MNDNSINGEDFKDECYIEVKLLLQFNTYGTFSFDVKTSISDKVERVK